MANYFLNDDGSLSKKNKKKKGNNYILQSNGTIQLREEEKEIAPTKKKEKERTWFTKGAFDDGYQIGDITKTVGSTVGDIGTSVAKGVTGIGDATAKFVAGGVAQVSDWIGQDDYAEKVRNRIAGLDEETNRKLANYTPTGLLTKANEKLDAGSVLGEKSDAIGEGVGYYAGMLALQQVGVPWQVTAGVTSAGNELSNAYANGSEDWEAWTSAGISATAEIISEYLSGGMKLKGTGKTMEALTGGVVDKIQNKLLKGLVGVSINAGGEGLEEVFSGFASAIGQKLTYMDDKELKELYSSEEALENFVTGALVSGVTMGATPSTYQNIKTGRNLVTGYTANEQQVLDNEVGKRTSEAQKQQAVNNKVNELITKAESTFGEVSEQRRNTIKQMVQQKLDNGEIDYSTTKLSNKEISKIEEQVKTDLSKGFIDIGTIESTLSSEKTVKIQELQQQLDKTKNDTDKQAIQQQINELQTAKATELRDLLKNDSYLQESYNQEFLKGKEFTYEAQETDSDITKELVESAKNAGMNNTRKMHDLFDWVNKVSNDKGTKYGFVNNTQLEEMGYYDDLKDAGSKAEKIGGLVRVEKDGTTKVLINVDSDKALNTIIGHETTHLLEGTNEYKLLQDAVKEYATTKGEYDTRLKAIQRIYEGTNANVESEVTADLVGDYLFTDEQFINNLSVKQPNVFTKIYDYIKHAYKMATAGSKEARQLEQLKYRFEQAYKQNVQTREATKINATTNTTAIDVSNKDDKGRELSKEQATYFKDSKVRDEKGNLLAVYHGTRGDFNVFETKRTGQNYEGDYSSLGRGSYFTSDINVAKDFGESSVNEGDLNIKETYLDIKNPFYADDMAKNDSKILKEISEKYDIKEDDLYNGYNLVRLLRNKGIDSTEVLQGYGYDGIIAEGEFVVFNSNQVKNVDNAKPTESKDIRYSLSEDTDVNTKINSSMTMDQAKRMIEMAFIDNGIYNWYDGKYKNGDEWLQGEGIDEVETYLDNTTTVLDKYLNPIYNKDDSYGDEYFTSDILQAYLDKTLTGQQKQELKRLDLSKDTGYKDNRFYAPQDIKGGQELYQTANQRVTNSNRDEVYKARADFIINAHNKGYIESLGLTQQEVNQKLKSWANYTKKAMELSNSLNEGVAKQNRWTGIENSSIVNTISISNEEMGKLVKEIQGNSSEWQRQYITSTMLALDTHIDYSNVTFKFDEHKHLNEISALGEYQRESDTILIGNGYQNTVAHEIGHYVDSRWARDLGLKNKYLSDSNVKSDGLTTEQAQFVNNFKEFINNISENSYLGSKYTTGGRGTSYWQHNTEIFARFVGRFVEWTKNQATNNRYGYEEKHYQDNFTESQYREFVKILQEKALLDTTNTKYSLNEDTAPTGNYKVYGKDVKVQKETKIDKKVQEIAPVQQELDLQESKTYYHGTRGDFEAFDNSKIGQNYEGEWSSLGKGFYFTDNYDSAKEFGESSINDGEVTVKEATLDIKNPFFVDDIAKNNNETITAIKEAYELGDINNGYNLIDGLKKKGLDSTEVLKQYGYDGIIAEDEVMVFDASQIHLNKAPVKSEQINTEVNRSEQIQSTTPTQEEVENLYDIQKNKSGSEYAMAFYDLQKKYGYTKLYKALNEYKSTGKVTSPTADDSFAPVSQEIIEQQRQDSMNSLVTEEAPLDNEFTTPEVIEDGSVVRSPLENRDLDEVGNRKVKAYQYEHPEVRPFFQEEADNMLGELDNTIKGEKSFNDQLYYDTNGEQGWYGTTRQTSEAIAYLKDNYGYSYEQIRKGLNAIIEDNGLENNAVSKRLEILIDERLRTGYKDFLMGYEIPANQEYINLLRANDFTDYYTNLANTITDDDIQIAPEPQNLIVEQPKTEVKQITPTIEKVAQNENTELSDNVKQRSWVKTSTESEVVKDKLEIEGLKNTTYEVKSNKKTLEIANEKLGRYGYEDSITYFNAKLMDKKVTTEDIVLGERLIQEALNKGDTKTASELIENVAILGTELGQKIQALSIIQRLTPEGQLRVLQKVVNRGKTKGDVAFENVEITQEMKDKILSTRKPDGSFEQLALNEVLEQVKQEIADQMKTTLGEKINAWRYLSMLGNPKTHIRNLISNVAMKGTSAVKNAMARTIEDIAPIKDKTKTWKRATKEINEYADRTTAEVKEILNGESSFSEDTSLKNKRQMFQNKILEKIYNFNSDLLTKEDWWFKKSTFKKSFAEYLTANGIRTKDDIKNNYKIVEKAKLYAMEQAQIATFSQYSYLANKINEIENKNIASKVIVGSAMPFKKTPINIAKAGLSYSPLGFAKVLAHDIPQVKNGNMEASQLIDNLSQATTGSALLLVGYMLAQAGFLNGGGEDDKEGKYDSQLGDMKYSIKIGDTSFSLSWLSPVAMPLFVGANAHELLVEKEEWNSDVVIETLAQTLDPLSEMSFLSGLTQVLSSYETGSMQQIAGMVESVTQNYVGQFIPTLSSQVAGTLDDTKRTTTATKSDGNKFIDTTINKLKYKIPGLRETLEPSLDIWGNEVKQAETIGERAIDNFIAPYSKKKDITTHVDTELKSIFKETGENSVLPSTPSSYLNYGDEKYNMTSKEFTDYKKKYGQTAYEMLEELFATNTYAESDSNEKAKLISKVYEYARDVSKKDYFDKHEVEYTNTTEGNIPVYKEKSIKNAIEYDMTPEEYSYFEENPSKYKTIRAITDYETYKTYSKDLYDIKGDKDDNGKTINNSRKNKVFDYINNLNLGFEQKVMLAKMEYPSYDEYNYEIIDYLNNNNNISYRDMEDILIELGFEVDAKGNIKW